MAKKISSMGSNTHSGINVDTIKNMGDAKLYDCVAHDVKIMGETHCEGCIFDYINCMGESYFEKSNIKSAKFMGEVEMKNSTIGEAIAMGDIEVVETGTIGNLRLMGSLKAQSLECRILSIGSKTESFLGLFRVNSFINSSAVKVYGNIHGETLESILSVKLSGNINYKNLIFLNSVSSTNEIECENFYSLNRLDIPSINSEYTYIRPFSKSKIQSITGSKVTICRDFSVTDVFKNIQKNYSDNVYEDYDKSEGILVVDLIEADDIYIENVNAKCVRGQRIVIGKNCTINRVEYTSDLEVSKDSKIIEKIKESI